MARQKIRLLMIDDDTVDRMACRRSLADQVDYEVEFVEAETALEGLGKAFHSHFDCILLDYHLPDLDGLEFLDELNRSPQAATLPVMMLTGTDDVAIAVQAMRRGARDFLVKDPSHDYLQLLPSIIEQLLREQRTMAEKQQAQAQYKALVEQIPAITYTASLDTPGKLLYVSPQIASLGYSPDEWVSHIGALRDHIHPEDHTRAVESFEKARLGTAFMRCEYRLRTRGGHYRWFRDEAGVLRDRTGTPLFLQGVLIDITEAKLLEDQLRQHRFRLEELVAKRTDALSRANTQLRQDLADRERIDQALFAEKERLHVTLESIADAVIATDAQGRIEYMNPVAEFLTGWDDAAARDKPLRLIFNTTPLEQMGLAAEDAASVATPANAVLLQRRDGTTITIAYSTAPIRDSRKRILGAVTVFRDVTKEHELARQLSYQATHDALTGLINRREFERRADRILASSRREGTEHAMCYVDLDQFKIVNDTCGHSGGDELLRQLTALLQQQMRHRDTLARLGGDEFGILLEHCPLEQAIRIAHEIRLAVRNFKFTYQSRTFRIGASIGLVPLDAQIEDLTAALSAADAACYAAKEQGRDRVHVYQMDDLHLAERRTQMRWVARISHALDEDRFHLCYQPITPLKVHDTAARPHYEILLRMIDEAGEQVLPAVFIPAAERYNLMPAVDRWVLKNVISHAAAWQRQRPAPLPIYAVNISGASLADANLGQFIRDLLQQHQLPAHALCIEITETSAIANINQATDLIRSLKTIGCLFALDDFGRGMSSFGYLKALPVDFLKIDRDFVRTIASDHIDRAMAEAINQVAHIMSIETVAEGAETLEVIEILRELQVDHAQGYAIMRPRSIEALGESQQMIDDKPLA